jgi:hypothetical protein
MANTTHSQNGNRDNNTADNHADTDRKTPKNNGNSSTAATGSRSSPNGNRAS